MVVRDLPLSPLSLFLRKLTGVPVIFDMAEDYPAMIRAFWKYRRPRPLDYLVRNPALLSALERFVLPRVDETWVVSEASCARIKPRTRGPVRVVRNTPNVDILEIEPHEPKTSERLRVVYTGWVDEDRGLNTVLRAVTLGKETGFEITFNIVGTGSMVPQLQELARSLKVEDAINFLGWQSQAQLRATIMENDVGVVPHHVTAHTSTTLPNKIYDYMALARPVVVSNAPALEQLVEYANCGLVFRDQDPSSLLASLRQLRSLDTRREMGANGRRQVSESMNWGVDETVIIGAVEKYDRCGL